MEKETILIFNQFLQEKGLTIAFAESMTAGLLSATVASVSGASSVLKGGIVCYDKQLKIRLLGVRKETLDAFGAESSQTTVEMAEGLGRCGTGADLLVAITGSASPPVNQYQTSTPAGGVFLCIGYRNGYFPFQAHFEGTRTEVLEQSVGFTFLKIREVVERHSFPE